VDDAPRAADDYLILVPSQSGTPLTVAVLDNDLEVDGQALSLEAVGTPSAGGAAQIVGNAIRYTSNLSLGESETITYTVSDGLLTDTAVLHVQMVAGDTTGQPGDTLLLPGLGPNQAINLSVTIPPNVTAGDEQVTLVVRQTAVPDSHPQGFKFAGLSFALDLYLDGTLTDPFVPNVAITLEISYHDDDVADIGTGDSELMLYRWDGSEWLTDDITLVTLDKVNNRLVVTLGHLSEFALFGKDMMTVYLPMIVKP
jgi:hypothetical protein